MVPARATTLMAFALALALALALAAGCTSSDGGAGGAGAGGASSDADGGPADGNVDVTPDASAPGDASSGIGPGPDAGDASVRDAGDPCATARFCETFEGYEAGKPPAGSWKVQTNLGAVSVTTDERYGGQKSARFTTQASTGGKTAFVRLDVASVFPVPGNAYFGRMMSRLESAPSQSVHWTFIASSGLVPGQSYHSIYRYGGQQPVTTDAGFAGSQLMANYDTPDSYHDAGPPSDCWNHSKGTVMPTGRWACVEWEFDGPNDTMRFWLDGVAVDALTVQELGQGCVHQPKTFAWKAPEFGSLDLGWESYQGDSARTLYLDDIVLSTERVGCPPSP